MTAPPRLYDLEAERAILGSILINPDALIAIAGELKPDDFFERTHAAVFRAMQELASQGEGIDIVTVSAALQSHQFFESHDPTLFLAGCTDLLPSPSIAPSYVRIVKEMAIRRAYEKSSQQIAAAAGDLELTVAEIRNLAESKLLAIQMDQLSGKTPTIRQHTSSWHDDYCEVHGLTTQELEARQVQTGFSSLQKYLHLAPGNVMILAGRTSMGKTALALNIAINACKKDKTVGFFSYEMTPHEVMDRVVAGRLGVPTKTLRQGELSDELCGQLGPVLDDINSYSLFIENNADRSLDTFTSRVRRLKLEHGLDLLVVDYLQLLFTNAKFAQQSRVQMVSHVSNTIKALAMELQCPIVALAQLSRKTEDRPNKRPQLADLRESGEIEQDADQVLMLYRDGYYNEDCENPNLTDVFIRKNRQGETGHVQLHFDSKRMQFNEVDYRSAI